jgi:hypothetical protein
VRLAAAQDPPVQWHLSARPSVVIGGSDNAHTRFLRIGTVLRLPGGEIVVLNAGTSEIRIFDRTGRFLRSLGGAGTGPGEFRSPRLVGHAGDTLFIADRVTARITELLVDGTPARSIRIAPTDAATGLTVVGRFADGRWAVVSGGSSSLNGPQRTYRDTSQVGILAPDATGGAVWIGSFPSQTVFVFNPANAPHGEVAAAVPSGPGWVSAVSGTEVLIGDTGANVIGAFSNAGAVLRLITVPLGLSVLTDEMITRWRQRAIAANPSERARPYLTALYSRAVLGPSLPVLGSIVSAADGSLWVEPYRADPAEPASWVVLDTAGKLRATVSVPGGFRITEAGPGYVVGVHTAADGIETVRLYQLTPQ